MKYNVSAFIQAVGEKLEFVQSTLLVIPDQSVFNPIKLAHWRLTQQNPVDPLQSFNGGLLTVQALMRRTAGAGSVFFGFFVSPDGTDGSWNLEESVNTANAAFTFLNLILSSKNFATNEIHIAIGVGRTNANPGTTGEIKDFSARLANFIVPQSYQLDRLI